MIRKSMRKWVSSLLLVTMTLGLAACGGSKEDEGEKASSDNVNEAEGGEGAAEGSGETTTISLFEKNARSDAFDDPVAAEITRITGVDVEVVNSPEEWEEKVTLALTGRDYADIMTFSSDSELVQKYIDAGALIPLNEYIDAGKLPNVKERYGKYLDMSKNAADEKNYYLPNWYGGLNSVAGAFNMRYDLMIELVGQERADSDEPFTQDEFVKLLKDFKEKYPEIDGKPTIALTMKPDVLISSFPQGMYGLKNYFEQEDGTLLHQTEDPRYVEWLKFMNQISREGYLDPEWVTMNYDTLQPKLAGNNVFGFIDAWWDSRQPNEVLKQDVGENAQYVAYQVLGKGVNKGETTYSGTNTLGWDSIGITDNCQDVDAALKLIDFLASEEGNTLQFWGVEGTHYTVDAEGKFTPADEIIEGYKKDSKGTSIDTGVGRWAWFVQGEQPNSLNPLRVLDWIDNQTLAKQMADKNLAGTVYDTAPYLNLEPQGNTPAGLQAQKIKDVVEETLPNIFSADSEAEMLKRYEEMVAELDQNGLEAVMEEVNKNYKSRMELWGEME
jgi:putative aldouronate transport system substrate-binding protein